MQSGEVVLHIAKTKGNGGEESSEPDKWFRTGNIK
jgi:hypothetical protein